MSNHSSLIILTGDLGGSNCRLKLIKYENSNSEVIFFSKFNSQEYSSLIDILQEFLKNIKTEIKIDLFVLAVCGVVVNNSSAQFISNLSYNVSGAEITKIFNFKVVILNDFYAAATGVLGLSSSDVISLNPNITTFVNLLSENRISDSNMAAIIGAGTGLGQAMLIPNNINNKVVFQVFPSEGGHSDFIPRNEFEYNFSLALLKLNISNIHLFPFSEKIRLKQNRICCEDFISGIGIVRLYWYYTTQFSNLVNSKLTNELATACKNGEDQAHIITKWALGFYDDDTKNFDELARKATLHFLSLYGSQIGNMTLQTLCTNGIYIGGGIAIKLKDFLVNDPYKNDFINSIISKGVLTDYIKDNIPIYLIKDPDSIGLLGCKMYALQKLSLL